MKKTESVAEFLARGGKIQIIPPQTVSIKSEHVRSQKSGGIASILTIDDHDLYHGEKKQSKKNAPKAPTIDFNALPEALKQKYLKELRNEKDERRN